MTKNGVLGGIVVAGLLASATAMGQGTPKPPAGKVVAGGKVKVDAKEANESLKGSDPSKIESTLATIRVAGKDGGKPFTAAIVARLKNGLSKSLVVKALDTLADLEDPAGAEAGEMYLAHRDGEVRQAAVRCLGGSKGPVAVKGLQKALTDPDGRVRGLAATLLGGTKAAEAVPMLVTALDKGVNESAVSIGQLCAATPGDKSCDVLVERMKTKPFDVISSGLGQMLARKDVSDDAKKKVITAVRELASQKAREFLVEIKTSWPKDGSKAVFDALDKAIKDLEGASK
ncbi:MAG: HEAT repeat domain-containing protein [Polyangiales bacterium]